MKPTKEQTQILEDFKSMRVMKVNAVAGSGKTSTLTLLAQEFPQSSLYMAFNKAIATEASERFPSHVECRTMHSLAFSVHGRKIVHKLSRPKGKYVNVAGTSKEVSIYYRISDFKCGDEKIPNTVVASLVKDTVRRFEQSADTKITNQHIDWKSIKKLGGKYEGFQRKRFCNHVISVATTYWKDRIDPTSRVKADHDTYLKMWQLSNPTLHFDIIYLDEAQDTSPVVADVVSKQTSRVVYVGDTYQSIYQFRGAVNAMETIVAPTRHLSMSFRYGDEIAKVAKEIICGKIDVKGNPAIDSKVGVVDTVKPYTHIFRTNAALLSEAVLLLSQGTKVKCEIDAKDFIKKLESVEALSQGKLKEVKHEDITIYSDFGDAKEDAKEDPELARLIKVVEQGDSGIYIKHLKNLEKRQDSADVVLTTAHKSKGRQWDQVVVADDFPLLDEGFSEMPDQERNLFYVACTRAIKTLQLPENY